MDSSDLKLFIIISIFITIGCSSSNPISSQQNDTFSEFYTNYANMLGSYELTIDTNSMTADLIPKRQSAIGESWTVSGLSYFETPSRCFIVSGLSYEPGLITVKFNINHPFEKGDTGQPPSARNRLDLDIFDLAMVVVPKPLDPITYPSFNISIPSYSIHKPDGFMNEFSVPFGSNIALPFVLVIDDTKNDPPASTFNRFEMGESTEFLAKFPMTAHQTLSFDLHLTFGYGFSAVLADRLDPKCYNPEFNRKPAWKVEVIPPHGNNVPETGNTWDNHDNTTSYEVTVKVFDWQIGADINPDLDENSDVYASSGVDSVSVEIPGMTDNAVTVDGDSFAPGGTGMPGSPLVYTIPIANENQLATGKYTGLVAVYDERSPLDLSEFRDYLIHTTDAGKNLIELEVLAYVTYQTFQAVVVDHHEPSGSLMWAKRAGGYF